MNTIPAPATTAQILDLSVTVKSNRWQDCDQAMVDQAAHVTVAMFGPQIWPDTNCIELAAFLIDDPEMQTLNRNWRGKDKATNVLAFATDAPVFEPNLPYPAGDVMLSYTTIAKEAKGFGLPFHHHLIHMVVHGVLHLMGFDHIHDDEAIRMEQHEQIILAAIKSQIASDISSPERTINRMQANA